MWLGIRGAQIQSEIQVRTTSPRNSATGQLCCQLCQMFWSFAFVSFAKRSDHSVSYADAPTKSSRLDPTKQEV